MRLRYEEQRFPTGAVISSLTEWLPRLSLSPSYWVPYLLGEPLAVHLYAMRVRVAAHDGVM